MLKFLRSNIALYTCNSMCLFVGLVFSMMIDIGPNFYSVPPLPMRVTNSSRAQTLIVDKVCGKGIKILHQPNFLFRLVNMSNSL